VGKEDLKRLSQLKTYLNTGIYLLIVWIPQKDGWILWRETGIFSNS